MSLNRKSPLTASTIASAFIFTVGLALGTAASLALCRKKAQEGPSSPSVAPLSPAVPTVIAPNDASTKEPSAIHSTKSEAPTWESLGLTCAETHIALRIISGRSFSSIAEELGVSAQSVRKTASRIYHKAGVTRRQDFTAQAVAFAPADQSRERIP